MNRKYILAISLALIITLVSVSPVFILHSPTSVQTAKSSGIEIISPGVTKSGNISGLAINQDASEIAFLINEKSGGSLWVASGINYASTSRIAHSPQQFSNLEWSLNGQEVLYVATAPGSVSLHVINLLNNDNRKVITLTGIQDAQWSPDNNMIVFSGLSNTGWNLYVTNTQTWITKQITTYGSDEYPSWCSNSSTIIFSRSYNATTSILATSLETGKYSSLLNYSGIDIWPTEDNNGTLAFESNASGSWTIVTDQNGTITDVLGIATYYTGMRSPTVDPQWPLIWASHGDQMFFVGVNITNNRIASYDINFSGVVLAATNPESPVDQQLYALSLYHLAVVNQVASNSTLPLIVTAWNQSDQTMFAITPSEPLSFLLVQFVPSSGITSQPNPYSSP